VWHLDLTSGAERVLTAESIYPDWPRLILVLLVVALIFGMIVMRSRRSRPAQPEPPIFRS
jgi:hypothetical protein